MQPTRFPLSAGSGVDGPVHLGLYSVMAYAVGQRTHETGNYMTLCAQDVLQQDGSRRGLQTPCVWLWRRHRPVGESGCARNASAADSVRDCAYFINSLRCSCVIGNTGCFRLMTIGRTRGNSDGLGVITLQLRHLAELGHRQYRRAFSSRPLSSEGAGLATGR